MSKEPHLDYYIFESFEDFITKQGKKKSSSDYLGLIYMKSIINNTN